MQILNTNNYFLTNVSDGVMLLFHENEYAEEYDFLDELDEEELQELNDFLEMH